MQATAAAAPPEWPIPVTILTGFLGSGKTTLLNRILGTDHGLRVAVVENEFGETDIDSELLSLAAREGPAPEQVVTLSNGCLCCTVRGDLLRALDGLAVRGGIDHILVETTGLAAPGPIVQSFFLDETLKGRVRLDGVVAVVDAVHAAQQMDRAREDGGVELADGDVDPGVNEAVEQIAFADRIVLNKTDAAGAETVAEVKRRIRAINGAALVREAVRCDVDVGWTLGVGGFDLSRVEDLLDEAPALAPAHGEPGHVCADANGGHDHDHDHDHDHEHDQDHAHALAHGEPGHVCASDDCGHDHDHTPAHGEPGHICDSDDCGHDHDHNHVHGHDRDKGAALTQIKETRHDDLVSSVSLKIEGPLDLAKVNQWLGMLVQYRGEDLYRFKGILSLKDVPERFVFQGVHMMFDGKPSRPWGMDEPRLSRMVFIGRELDADLLQEGFEHCVWQEYMGPPAKLDYGEGEVVVEDADAPPV